MNEHENNSDSQVGKAQGDALIENSSMESYGNQENFHSGEKYIPSLQRRRELLKECEAIVVYISRHGNILDENENLPEAYNKLSQLVAKCGNHEPTPDDWNGLVVAYADVTRVTYGQRGVNGRSVLDTWGEKDWSLGFNESEKPRTLWKRIIGLGRRSSRPYHRKVLCIALAFLVFALALQLLAGWTKISGDPDNLQGYTKHIYHFSVNLLPLLIPAVWGAIGSCVFLMKRISDKLFEFAYEESRLKGYGVRIFLGSVLGVVVAQLFFTNTGEPLTLKGISFGAITAAFIAGLGVKPIYAAFETFTEGLAARMSDTDKQKKQSPNQ